jgi:Holliday junction resolvase RusA-like endonuclease
MIAFLELKYPPSTNVIYRRSGFHTYLTNEGKRYKQDVADYVSENAVPKFGDAKLKITFTLRPRDKRKRDISNCIKIAEDALQDSGVFDDDFQIEELTIKRGEPISGGLLLVTIEDIENND